MVALIALLKANKAAIGYASVVAGLLFTLYQLHSAVYESGRESMRTELIAQHNAAMENARKDYEKRVNESMLRVQADHADELARVRNEREIITKVEKVTEYVDREIIVQAECDDLADSVVVVLQQAADIIRNPRNESP